MPERNQNEASPATLLVESRTQQKSFLFLLEEKIRRAQIRKSEENFFAGWRVVASGGGAAFLVLFKVGSRKVYNYSTTSLHDLSWSEVVPKGGVEPPFRVYESLVLTVELLRRICILTYFPRKYCSTRHFHVIYKRMVKHYKQPRMWDTILFINSILWAIASIYFVYSVGAAILKWDVRIFLYGFGWFLFFLITEIILGGLKKH